MLVDVLTLSAPKLSWQGPHCAEEEEATGRSAAAKICRDAGDCGGGGCDGGGGGGDDYDG